MRDEIITARSGQAPEGGIQDKTTTCVIVSESQNLKIYKETTLLLFSQVFVFLFERISALQSQVSSQCVEISRIAGCRIEEAYVGPSKTRCSDSLSVPLDFTTNRFVARATLHTGWPP